MEFCPITPVNLLETYAIRSRWQMCVALWGIPLEKETSHEQKARSKYWQFYKGRVLAGDIVILDNGAWERQLVDQKQYLTMIQDLKPTAYVVPDEVGNFTRSMEMINEWADFVHGIILPESIMVFQGDENSELEEFLRRATDLNCRWIGLSKGSGHFRKHFAAYIRENYPKMKIHALGFIDENPLDEIAQLSALGVGSIDSSEPVWRGLNGNRMVDPPFRGSRFRDCIFDSTCYRDDQVERNLIHVVNLCQVQHWRGPSVAPAKAESAPLKMGGGSRDELHLPYDLIPKSFLDDLASIFHEGLRYGRHNWKAGNDQFFQNCLNHAQAHLSNYNDGDRSENHLAKVAWNVLAASWKTKQEKP